jgi:hypothetical protein
MFRIHSNPREPFGNGRKSDVPAKRRCVVEDLIETGCTEGKIEAERGGVVSPCDESRINRIGDALNLGSQQDLLIPLCNYLSLTTDNQQTVQVQSEV